MVRTVKCSLLAIAISKVGFAGSAELEETGVLLEVEEIELETGVELLVVGALELFPLLELDELEEVETGVTLEGAAEEDAATLEEVTGVSTLEEAATRDVLAASLKELAGVGLLTQPARRIPAARQRRDLEMFFFINRPFWDFGPVNSYEW